MKISPKALIKKYEVVLQEVYELTRTSLLNRNDASAYLRKTRNITHASLMWNALIESGTIHTKTPGRVIKWVGSAPNIDLARYVVNDIRKRNKENARLLTAKRLLAKEEEEKAAAKASAKTSNQIGLDYTVFTPLDQAKQDAANELKTVSINGSTITAPAGTKVSFDSAGQVTITL